jgi:hypothetical protein
MPLVSTTLKKEKQLIADSCKLIGKIEGRRTTVPQWRDQDDGRKDTFLTIDGFLSSLIELDGDYLCHGIEVIVVVKKEEVMLKGGLDDNAINRAPDCNSLLPAVHIDPGGSGK